eukprot:c22647_g1_i1 orf=267-2213(-)
MEVELQQEENAGHQASQQSTLGFAGKLASPDKKTRDEAIALLIAWLTSQQVVTEDQFLKIWVGLFYCIWHADRLPAQSDLIESLASLLGKLDVGLSFQFFEAFVTTMRREWDGIVSMQLDKFHLLLRKFLFHMFGLLKNQQWNADWTRKFVDTLEERILLVQGVGLYYADIFLSELQNFLPIQAETFTLLLRPFCNVLGKASDKSLVKVVKENVFDRLLDLGHAFMRGKQERLEIDDCVEHLGFLALTVPISSMLFNRASLPFTPEANGEVLYSLHEEFSKLKTLWTILSVSISAGKVTCEELGFGEEISDDLGGSTHTSAKGLVEDSGYSTNIGDSAQQVEVRKRLACDKALSTVNDGNENLPPVEEFGKHFERKEEGSAAGKIVTYNRKLHKRNIFEVGMPEKHTQITSSTELYRKKRRCFQNAEGNGAPDTLQCEVTVKTSDGRANGHVKEQSLECIEDSSLRIVNGDKFFGFDDPVISNLEKRFDSISAEDTNDLDGLDTSMVTFPLSPSPINTCRRKRKRGKCPSVISPSGQENEVSPSPLFPVNCSGSGNMSEKKLKKVRFSLKNNLIWKPFSPLPPQILRVPPSATPRGSALKKGVPPGPIVAVKEPSQKQRKVAIKKTTPIAQRTPRSLKSLVRGSKTCR